MQKKPPDRRTEYIVERVSIDLIDTQDQEVREISVDDDLQALAASIAAYGLLQLPGVSARADGHYNLLWGRRRLEAHKLLQWSEMMCRVYPADQKEVKILAGIENIARRQMHLAEECRYVADLHLVGGISVNELVEKTGHSRSWILLRLAIPNFPVEIRDAVLDGAISLGAAEEIAACEDDSQRGYILNQAIYTKAPITELRKMVQLANSAPTATAAVEAGVRASQETYAVQEQRIECAFCAQPMLAGELINIRVCRGGCKEEKDVNTTNEPETGGLGSGAQTQ